MHLEPLLLLLLPLLWVAIGHVEESWGAGIEVTNENEGEVKKNLP